MAKQREDPASLADECLEAGLLTAIISTPKRSTQTEENSLFDKIRIRPISLKGEPGFQLEQFRGPKVFHRNVTRTELKSLIAEWLAGDYGRAEFAMTSGSLHVLANRRGELTALRKPSINKSAQVPSTPPEIQPHNRVKKYILEEGTPVPFLVDLGVMSGDGAIHKAKYDKFRQINRFLEFIADVLPELRQAAKLTESGELTIVDFGCGKSYLTFAVYYYLSVLQKIPVRILGLDLKEDVIAHCSALAETYGYKGLSFTVGDIADYTGTDRADMVISLHACDTATDYALAQAVRWQARVILAVPCCQHEINSQLASADNRTLSPAFRHGIIRERMAALFTDAMRAELLETQGYQVQILEFIDMSHTPKNLLIRAVLKDRATRHDGTAPTGKALHDSAAYANLRDFLGVRPMLEHLLER